MLPCEQVVTARIFNVDHLDSMLIQAAALMADPDSPPFRLLVLDSIIGWCESLALQHHHE